MNGNQGKGLRGRPLGRGVETASIQLRSTTSTASTRPSGPAGRRRPPGTTPPCFEDAGPVRVLLAEADPASRERLRAQIAAVPGLAVAGVAAEGSQAFAALALARPDFALLSLDLPGGDAAALIARTGPRRMPPFALLAGDPQDALKAFELGAFDFLLRPVDPGRSAAVLSRARAEVAQRRAWEEGRQLALLAGGAAPARRAASRVTFRLPGRLLVFEADEIEWIESAGNYVRVHAQGRSHLVRETLESVQARIGSDRFVRLHRSALVHLDSIQELVHEGAGEVSTVLKSGRRLPTSRSYRERLETALALRL